MASSGPLRLCLSTDFATIRRAESLVRAFGNKTPRSSSAVPWTHTEKPADISTFRKSPLDRRRPSFPYALTKVACENILLDAHRPGFLRSPLSAGAYLLARNPFPCHFLEPFAFAQASAPGPADSGGGQRLHSGAALPPDDSGQAIAKCRKS